MTAIVSQEHARTTWLTGAAGLLLLVAAFVMMTCATPRVVHPQPARPAATRSVPADQLLSRVWTAPPAPRP